MLSSKNINLKSILLINDYLSICKLQNPNCAKTKIVRLYLCHRLNLINDKPKPIKTNLMFYIFILLLLIK